MGAYVGVFLVGLVLGFKPVLASTSASVFMFALDSSCSFSSSYISLCSVDLVGCLVSI